MSATTGLPRFAELGNHAREVVLQEGLAVRCEHADGRAAGGRVGRGEAEEQLLPAGALERLDAVGDRAVLVFRERTRIDDFENDAPVGSGDIGVEQRPHPRRESRELRRLLGEGAGHEHAEAQRLLDFAEQRAGALAQRIKMLLREVDAGATQHLRADDVDAHEDDAAEQRGDHRNAPGRKSRSPGRRPRRFGSAGIWLSGIYLIGLYLVGHGNSSRRFLDFYGTHVEPQAERDQRHEEDDGRHLQHAVGDALEVAQERHRPHRFDDHRRRP